jgi:hypothetical protein
MVSGTITGPPAGGHPHEGQSLPRRRCQSVEWPEGQRPQTQLWYGRLEALLSRHGPEATALLPLTSGVLRRCLARYGGPRGLAEDPKAADRLYRWGKGLLGRD